MLGRFKALSPNSRLAPWPNTAALRATWMPDGWPAAHAVMPDDAPRGVSARLLQHRQRGLHSGSALPQPLPGAKGEGRVHTQSGRGSPARSHAPARPRPAPPRARHLSAPGPPRARQWLPPLNFFFLFLSWENLTSPPWEKFSFFLVNNLCGLRGKSSRGTPIDFFSLFLSWENLFSSSWEKFLHFQL